MNRIAVLSAGIVFLGIAALALYRLVVGIRITIGEVELGQTTTFLILVVSAALSLMLFKGTAVRD